MTRRWGIMLMIVATVVAGCATEAGPAAAPSQTTSTSAPTTTSSAAPVAKLTQACPLLSNDDLTRLLNNGKDAQLTPTEAAPEDDEGSIIYKCTYGRGGTTALELVAREFTADGRTAATVIDAIGKASNATTTPVAGVGEAGVFYRTSDGLGVVLAAAKMSGASVRVIVLAGPKVLPQDKLTNVAALVIQRV